MGEGGGGGCLAIFLMICLRFSDRRLLRSLCIKGTCISTLDKDSLVPLVHSHLSDLRSLILVQPSQRNAPLVNSQLEQQILQIALLS